MRRSTLPQAQQQSIDPAMGMVRYPLGVIADWEHHELRRARRDLYHLSHEVAIREAHTARRGGADWFVGQDFRNLALLADVIEAFAATSRTGSRPPDEAPIADDGTSELVKDLSNALTRELTDRRIEATGPAATALELLLHKADWARRVLDS